MIKFSALILIVLLTIRCSEQLPVEDDLRGMHYVLLNQDSVETVFPGDAAGKVAIVGYIFTNCPDICPLTTNNMRLIKEGLENAGINNVEFISISFDPQTDRPHILKQYANIRDLDLSNWKFLTGDIDTISALMNDLGILTVPSDTSVTSSGKEIIYYVHTDRISLMDEKGRIRKNYRGSQADIEEVIKDIELLID